MNDKYNSRQRKIYQDYNVHSTDSLLEMVKQDDKYLSEVIEVIDDILVERRAKLPHYEEPATYNQFMEQPVMEDHVIEQPVTVQYEQDDTDYEAIRENEEEVKSFVNKLRDQSDSDLTDIITRYIDYKQETVTAALIVSVDKGLITYELKGLLSEQIGANFAAHARGVRRFKWERNNAFVKYLSNYQDDDIYNIIDDPKGIVIDVYHAFLLIARDRELISEDDFAGFYKDAKLGIRTEREIKMAEFDEYLKSDYTIDDIEDIPDDIDIEAEKEKYWKCPVCNQLVGMEFGICWNCQSEVPHAIEHPDKEDIIKEIVSQQSFSLTKAGFSIIFAGILIGAGGQLHRHNLFFDSDIDFISLGIGGLVALVGIGILIFGLFQKTDE